MYGAIKWYNPNKGYGYIIGSDDETYFFRSAVAYIANEQVLFTPNLIDLMYVATNIEKITQS